MALEVKDPPANAGDTRDEGLILGSRTILWRRKWQLTPVLLGKFPWTEEIGGL